MKNLTLLFLYSFFLFIQCKSDVKNKDSEEITEVKERNGESHDEDNDQGDDEDNTNDETSINIDLKDLDLKDLNFKKGKSIPTDDLKMIFPNKLGRLEKQKVSSESSGAFGFNITNVKGRYENDEKEIELEIIDFGGIPAIASLLAAWTKTDIHHEDDKGFEKVSVWKGYKSFEKWNKEDNNSSMTFLYKDRLLVNASADKIGLDDLKEILEDDLLDELEDLKIPKDN